MLVGLTGYKGSGKSTVAFLLEQQGFVRLRFAGILKDMLRTLGLTEAELDGVDKESPCELLGGQTPRFAMQTLGTEWGRQLMGEDLWVRAMQRRLARHLPQNQVVIDDVRFPNEARLIIRVFGGMLWRIQRPGHASDGHASERAIAALPVGRTVYNTGTVAELHGLVSIALLGAHDQHAVGA